MKKTFRFYILASALLLSACAGTLNGKASERKDIFISSADAASVSVPAYPKEDSAVYAGDLETLHRLQSARTEEQCAAAGFQARAEIWQFFPDYKPYFDSLSEKSRIFLNEAYKEAYAINRREKNRYKRPRPFLADPAIEPCPNIGRIKGYSYPSGHATMAAFFTRLMLEIDPDNSDFIRSQGFQAGLNREIAGVHYPSDVEMGTQLGEAIFDRFLSDKDFAKGLKRLKKEFKKYVSAHYYWRTTPLHFASSLKDFSVEDYPKEGTAGYERDFAVLREWQRMRTEDHCARALAQKDATPGEFFPGYKDFFDSLSAGDREFMRALWEDQNKINGTLKHFYRRPRPFLTDSSLSPCIGKAKGYSYPSGHATVAELYARIIEEIDPGNTDKVSRLAYQAGLNRVIGGVHHPSDVEAGFKLGDEIFDNFMKNELFVKKLGLLKKDFEKFAAKRKVIK